MLFPKDSAFSRTEDQEAHLKAVRERALYSENSSNPDVREALQKEAERLAEEFRDVASEQQDK